MVIELLGCDAELLGCGAVLAGCHSSWLAVLWWTTTTPAVWVAQGNHHLMLLGSASFAVHLHCTKMAAPRQKGVKVVDAELGMNGLIL